MLNKTLAVGLATVLLVLTSPFLSDSALGGYLYGTDQGYHGELLRIDPATGAIVETLIQTGALHGGTAARRAFQAQPGPAR